MSLYFEKIRKHGSTSSSASSLASASSGFIDSDSDTDTDNNDVSAAFNSSNDLSENIRGKDYITEHSMLGQPILTKHNTRSHSLNQRAVQNNSFPGTGNGRFCLSSLSDLPQHVSSERLVSQSTQSKRIHEFNREKVAVRSAPFMKWPSRTSRDSFPTHKNMTSAHNRPENNTGVLLAMFLLERLCSLSQSNTNSRAQRTYRQSLLMLQQLGLLPNCGSIPSLSERYRNTFASIFSNVQDQVDIQEDNLDASLNESSKILVPISSTSQPAAAISCSKSNPAVIQRNATEGNNNYHEQILDANTSEVSSGQSTECVVESSSRIPEFDVNGHMVETEFLEPTPNTTSVIAPIEAISTWQVEGQKDLLSGTLDVAGVIAQRTKHILQNKRFHAEFTGFQSLGIGGFGSVYKAMNIYDEAWYAIKVIPILENEADRVLDEASILANVQHEHIVSCKTTWLEVDFGALHSGLSENEDEGREEEYDADNPDNDGGDGDDDDDTSHHYRIFRAQSENGTCQSSLTENVKNGSHINKGLNIESDVSVEHDDLFLDSVPTQKNAARYRSSLSSILADHFPMENVCRCSISSPNRFQGSVTPPMHVYHHGTMEMSPPRITVLSRNTSSPSEAAYEFARSRTNSISSFHSTAPTGCDGDAVLHPVPVMSKLMKTTQEDTIREGISSPTFVVDASVAPSNYNDLTSGYEQPVCLKAAVSPFKSDAGNASAKDDQFPTNGPNNSGSARKMLVDPVSSGKAPSYLVNVSSEERHGNDSPTTVNSIPLPATPPRQNRTCIVCGRLRVTSYSNYHDGALSPSDLISRNHEEKRHEICPTVTDCGLTKGNFGENTAIRPRKRRGKKDRSRLFGDRLSRDLPSVGTVVPVHKHTFLQHPQGKVCLFIQMELCDDNLHNWLRKCWKESLSSGVVTLEEARIRMEILNQLLNAVSFLHSKGLIHRDIKPQNILLNKPNTNPKVLLADFGLARIISPAFDDIENDPNLSATRSTFLNARHDFNLDVAKKANILRSTVANTKSTNNSPKIRSFRNSRLGSLTDRLSFVITDRDQSLSTKEQQSSYHTEIPHSCLTEGLGTETYAAPEQRQGRSYCHKVDMYSIGIILLELMYNFKTETERGFKIINLKNCEPPMEFMEAFSVQCSWALNLVSKDPKMRFSASELRRRLLEFDFDIEAQASDTPKLQHLLNGNCEDLRQALGKLHETNLHYKRQLKRKEVELEKEHDQNSQLRTKVKEQEAELSKLHAQVKYLQSKTKQYARPPRDRSNRGSTAIPPQHQVLN